MVKVQVAGGDSDKTLLRRFSVSKVCLFLSSIPATAVEHEHGGNKHGKIEMNLHTSMTGGVSYMSLNELNCKSHFRKP